MVYTPAHIRRDPGWEATGGRIWKTKEHMKKRTTKAKTKAAVEELGTAWMAEEIRRIDLKAYKSASALLKVAVDLLSVADTGTASTPHLVARTLELIREAQAELHRVERKRKQLPLNGAK